MRLPILIFACLCFQLNCGKRPPLAVGGANNPSSLPARPESDGSGQTEKDAVQTEKDAVQTVKDAVQTEKDAVQTVKDAVQTDDKIPIKTMPEAPEVVQPPLPRIPEPCSNATSEPSDFKLGQSYFGTNDFVEYIPGNLPIILSAPHGGYLEPSEIPVSPVGLIRDSSTQETARLIYKYLGEKTGRTPHLIINRLTRNRVNLNRSKNEEPNAGNVSADRAWDEYHVFVEAAKKWVTSACGKGHFFDIHSNGHIEGWVEVGHGLSGKDLNLSDADIESQSFRDKSTIRNLANTNGIRLADLIRGPSSLGGLLESSGIKSVPSPKFPNPGTGNFFSGGYNTLRYGSANGGVVDGTQIEIHFSHINKGVPEREASSLAIA